MSDLGAAALTRRVGALRAAGSVQLAAVVVMSPYLFVASGVGSLSVIEWLELVGLAVGAIVFYLAFYRALQLGPVAIVSPILAAHAAIVVIMAVFVLGEHLSASEAVICMRAASS